MGAGSWNWTNVHMGFSCREQKRTHFVGSALGFKQTWKHFVAGGKDAPALQEGISMNMRGAQGV
eukprot:11587829-Karenia_brevis.AAC.1